MSIKIKLLLVLLVGLSLEVIIYIFFVRDSRDNTLKRKGNEIVASINEYKKSRGKLPNSLNDIGIIETETGPLYYDKQDSIHYVVWFGTTLGQSVTYHSDSHKWVDE